MSNIIKTLLPINVNLLVLHLGEEMGPISAMGDKQIDDVGEI